ncbi:choline kinase, putative [Bodo saltans]|uniref:Choline kinase, putative n=1 Tax=Bodo saltans TaxID=75058 RepID=A0A0S4JCZ4_BODSA|nr:choline kinase, putative [Bodo saltans]|eukprot:CUG87959.1 choline kinase, putative [Bodo saltans]
MLPNRSLKTILCLCCVSAAGTKKKTLSPSKVSVNFHDNNTSLSAVTKRLHRSLVTLTSRERQLCTIPHPILNGSQRGWDNEAAFCRDVHLEVVLGGNSNTAYMVTFTSGGLTPSDEKNIPRPLLLKVYGTAMTKIVDRSTDVDGSIAASLASLGPGVVALFEWGRLEVFLPGYNNHTTALWMNADEPWYLRSVAVALRTFRDRCSTDLTSGATSTPSQPASLDLHLSRFLGCFADAAVPAKDEDDIVKAFFANCEAEKNWLLEQCVAIGDDLVFSHCDSNPSNLMWKRVTSPTSSSSPSGRTFSPMRVPIQQEQEPHCTSPNTPPSAPPSRSNSEMMELFLIDYEYCGWNFPFFDLGNVVCEMDYDYETSHGHPTTEPVACTLPANGGDDWKSADGYCGFVKPTAEQHKNDDYHYPRLAMNILSCIRAKESGLPYEGDNLAAHIVENFVAPFFDVPASSLTVNDHFRRLALGMLSSNLKWGVWGCAICSEEAKHDAKTATVTLPRGSSGLDYAAYSECRLRDYEALKALLTKEKIL